MITEEVTAIEVVEDTFNRFRASILSIIESANLPPKQEKALRTLIKYRSYQDEAVIKELIECLDEGQLFKYRTKYLDSVDDSDY